MNNQVFNNIMERSARDHGPTHLHVHFEISRRLNGLTGLRTDTLTNKEKALVAAAAYIVMDAVGGLNDH